MSATELLPEKEWRTLIRDIHNGHVLPIIGPDLITVPDHVTGHPIALQRHLAPLLAARLGLVCGTAATDTVNSVACAHLLAGGARKDIYDELREILDATKPEPSPALLALASITDLNLYICSTFDHHLAAALAAERPGFQQKNHLIAYHPTQAVDIPEPLHETMLFHVLGDFNTYPDFAVWEEDHMEYICGLLAHQAGRDFMPNIFRQLEKRYLLLLGAPFNDWIVRFFLRTARNHRFSERGAIPDERLADRSESLDPALVFYFEDLINAKRGERERSNRVIRGDPAAFVVELARRWQEKHGSASSDDDFIARLPDEMPKDSVFISFAREDRESAIAVARALHSGGVPVWLNKAGVQPVQPGQNYESHLKKAVADCSFFVSLISATTEADGRRERYFHQERDWIAARHSDGFLYYLPVAIHLNLPDRWHPQNEPGCFDKSHYTHLPGGRSAGDFACYLRTLVETFRSSGRPRG